MNRLYILLTVMVVMVGTLFAGHQALAKVLTGTGGADTLLGTDRNDRLQGSLGADRLKGNRGNDRLWGSRGNDKIIPGDGNDKVYAGYGDDLDGVDHIDCGPGFDKVETIHRDDETLSNCEIPRPSPGSHLGLSSQFSGTHESVRERWCRDLSLACK